MRQYLEKLLLENGYQKSQLNHSAVKAMMDAVETSAKAAMGGMLNELGVSSYEELHERRDSFSDDLPYIKSQIGNYIHHAMPKKFGFGDVIKKYQGGGRLPTRAEVIANPTSTDTLPNRKDLIESHIKKDAKNNPVRTQKEYLKEWYNDPVTREKIGDPLSEEAIQRIHDTTVKKLPLGEYREKQRIAFGRIRENSPGLNIYREGADATVYHTDDIRIPTDTNKVLLHELTHSTGFDKKMYSDSNLNKQYGTKFRTKHEAYPRVMELRQHMQLRPGDEVTPEMINKVKDSFHAKRLLEFGTAEQISAIMNSVAINENSEGDFKAQAGGRLKKPERSSTNVNPTVDRGGIDHSRIYVDPNNPSNFYTNLPQNQSEKDVPGIYDLMSQDLKDKGITSFIGNINKGILDMVSAPIAGLGELEKQFVNLFSEEETKEGYLSSLSDYIKEIGEEAFYTDPQASMADHTGRFLGSLASPINKAKTSYQVAEALMSGYQHGNIADAFVGSVGAKFGNVPKQGAPDIGIGRLNKSKGDLELLNEYKGEIDFMVDSIPVEDKRSMEFATEFIRTYGSKTNKALMGAFDDLAKANPTFDKWRKSSRFLMIDDMQANTKSYYYNGSKAILHNPYMYIDSVKPGQSFSTLNTEIAAHEMVHAFTTDIFDLGSRSMNSALAKAGVTEEAIKKASKFKKEIEDIAEEFVLQNLKEKGGMPSVQHVKDMLGHIDERGLLPEVKNIYGEVMDRKVDKYIMMMDAVKTDPNTMYGLFGWRTDLYSRKAKTNPREAMNSFSPDEFVAHLLTNDDFRKQLSKYSSGGKNFYQKIREALEKMMGALGFGKDSLGKQAARKVLDAIENTDFDMINRKIEEVNKHNTSRTSLMPGEMESALGELGIRTFGQKKAFGGKMYQAGGILKKKPVRDNRGLTEHEGQSKLQAGGPLQMGIPNSANPNPPGIEIKPDMFEDFIAYYGPDHEGGGVQTNEKGYPGNGIELEGEEPVAIIKSGDQQYAFSKRLTL